MKAIQFSNPKIFFEIRKYFVESYFFLFVEKKNNIQNILDDNLGTYYLSHSACRKPHFVVEADPVILIQAHRSVNFVTKPLKFA